MVRATSLVAFLAATAAATPRAGFASYKNARLLCTEHVASTTMHLDWSSYATRDTVDAVTTWYEKSSKRKAKPGDNGSRQLEWDENHKLDIFPASEFEKFPHCDDKKPKPNERTIILMSNVSR
jgi:hypothetical protein